MVLRDFPDLAWLKRQAASNFEDQRRPDGSLLAKPGWPAVVLHFRSRAAIRDRIAGPLSLFTNLNGSSYVTAGGKRVLVNPGTYFMSNAREEYTLEIPEGNTTEIYNFHFSDDIVRQVSASLGLTTDGLLESPDVSLSSPGFHNRLELLPADFLSRLESAVEAVASPMAWEEHLGGVVETLMINQQVHEQRAFNIRASKPSTRNEVFRRLTFSTDFLYANFTSNPTLEDAASAACLSRFHFLRLFREAYGKTPHQFLLGLRMERAKTLLENQRLTVAEIASQVGFPDTSSFSKAFFRANGVWPSSYRKGL